MNFIDRMISFFSPVAGLKRAAARSAMHIRGYDAASRGRRFKNMKTSAADAEREIAEAGQIPKFRARQLVRNNWVAVRAVQAIVSNTVGHGIELKIQNERVSELWKSWARTRAIDFESCHDFFGLQKMALETTVQSGDILFKRVKLTAAQAKGGVPLKIQLLESDYIDTSKNSVDHNGNIIRQGIEFDDSGRVVAYWLYPEHPGALVTMASLNRFSSERFTTDEVRILYRKDRPGQSRGMSWFAPVMLRIKDFEEYEDAQLYRQKIAACFAGFLETTDLPLNSSSQADNPINEKLEPGTMEVLPPGKRIVFSQPPGVGSDYDAYVRRSLLGVASGLGITYEALTSDLSNVNFSSGRMGWLEMHRNLETWRWHMLIPQFCEVVWDWFLEAVEVSHGIDRASVGDPIWTPPRREMIDPVKETNAMQAGVRNGFISYSETLRQLGQDPDAVMTEIKGDQEKLDSLQLTLESDPRFTLRQRSQAESTPQEE